MSVLGKFAYQNVFGSRTLGDEDVQPLALDSVMWIASCTKLLTSIAAMQCVERGLVALDEDLRPKIKELNDLDILEADTEGKLASQRKNESPITLR